MVLFPRHCQSLSLALAMLGVLVSCGGGSTGGGGGGGGGGGANAPLLVDPPHVDSVDGTLTTTMTVMPAMHDVAGEKDVVFFALYNGNYMPETLRVQRGDTVDILLQNYAVQPTNLHYHGMIITPKSSTVPPGQEGGFPVNGDNIFLSITPGIEFQYSFGIPDNHPEGMFWYHPHRDPLLNTQIAGGMSGAIIVGDILAPFPQLANIKERLMVLKDLKLMNKMPVDDPDPAGPTKRTVNGQWMPRIDMVPGEMEFWRIGNQSSNIFYQLTFGGQPFHIIGVDGSLENQVSTTTTMLMPPGSRREVLVYGPPKGTYKLKTEAYNTGPSGDAYPGQVLMTVKSSGTPVAEIPLPVDFPPLVPGDMTSLVTNTKTVKFQDTPNSNQFYVDGKPFTPDCIDYMVERTDTAVEEWTIENTSGEAHVFHIHQLEFQVTEVNGVAVPFTGYNDVVTLPPAINASTEPGQNVPSTVKVIIPFTDAIIAGKFVYHCHIIQHEDLGMMATILVYEAGDPPPTQPPCHADPPDPKKGD